MPTSVIAAVAAEAIGVAVAESALAYEAIASVSWLTYTQIQMATGRCGSTSILGTMRSELSRRVHCEGMAA